MTGKITIATRSSPARYYLDGKEVTKAEFDAAFPTKANEILSGGDIGVQTDWSKPIMSDALAVHPSQVQEAYDDSVKKGVPTQFDKKTGQPEFRSRQHRRDYLKAYGVRDRDGGYGD
jgi:hypothetical protein